MTRAASVSTREAYSGTLYFVALLRKELGSRIKIAREATKMTQRELADAIGLKNAADVSRYERGIVEVPSHRIDLIAEATGRPRSYFTRDPAEAEVIPLHPGDHLEEVAGGIADLLNGQREILRRLAAIESAVEGAAARPRARTTRR